MTDSDPYGPRLNRLVRAIRKDKLDAMLVWARANTRYLTGFRGTASLICLTPDRGYFLTDFRYFSAARATVPHLMVIQTGQPAWKALARILKQHRASRVGFEDLVPYRQYRMWSENIGFVQFVEAAELITLLRARKSAQEQRKILAAQKVAERALRRTLEECRPGITECELARYLLNIIEQEGGEGPSFDPIVASGPNAALPHAHPSERRLKKGDLVIFDLGVFVDGYASDMTRTVVVGRATERHREIYRIVLEAQERAIAAIRAGVEAKKVDHAARSWIEKKGFGKQFGHGTGHGVGLEIHESPALNPQSKDILDTGMIVTIEPGIYLRGWGGVRIEDMVAVTRDGAKVVGAFTKELIEK